MPLSRTKRQRASRASQVQEHGHSPKIDAFGTVHIGNAEYKARAINYAPGRLALFRDIAPQAPVLLELTSEIQLKGRLMRAEIAEGEVVFQKAGCGCETPRALRGGRNALLQGAGLS